MATSGQWFVRLLTFLGAFVLCSWLLQRIWPLIPVYTGLRMSAFPLGWPVPGIRYHLPMAIPVSGLLLALIIVAIVIACQKSPSSTPLSSSGKTKGKADAKPAQSRSPEATKAEAKAQAKAYEGIGDIVDDVFSQFGSDDKKGGNKPH